MCAQGGQFLGYSPTGSKGILFIGIGLLIWVVASIVILLGHKEQSNGITLNLRVCAKNQPTPLEIFNFPFEDDTPYALEKDQGWAYVREK